MSTVLLLGKVRKSKSQSQAPASVSYVGYWQKSTTKQPTEQTDKKNPVVLFLVVKRNPVFSEDLCESGVCGVWPHHPELLLGALA